MTERERWIVYPLLFLALGAGLRDKLADRTISKSIVCQELVVVDEDSGEHSVARIGLAKPQASTQPPIGQISIVGQLEIKGQLAVDGEILANQVRAGTVIAENYHGLRMVPAIPAAHPESEPQALDGQQQSDPAERPQAASQASSQGTENSVDVKPSDTNGNQTPAAAQADRER